MTNTENQTRKEIIDKQLLTAGWDITDCTQVIEAEKTSKDAETGLEQAKQYCYNIQKQYNCRLPLCFYTNEFEIFFWDLENYPLMKIIGYPTRDDLERYHYVSNNNKLLSEELINTDIVGCPCSCHPSKSWCCTKAGRQGDF